MNVSALTRRLYKSFWLHKMSKRQHTKFPEKHSSLYFKKILLVLPIIFLRREWKDNVNWEVWPYQPSVHMYFQINLFLSC